MNIRRIFNFFNLLAAGFLGLVSVPANAITVTTADIGSSFTINWSLLAGSLDNDGGTPTPISLSATGTFLISGFSSSSLALSIGIENTTVVGSGENAGITSFGMGVTPNATSVIFSDASDGAFAGAEVQTNQQNYPGGYKNIDVCVFTQGCSGGSQGSALAAGSSDSFQLQIFGDFSGGSIALDPFPIKFQTTYGSFEFSGNGNTPPPPPTVVPAPETLALMALGLLSLVWSRRRLIA